MKAVWVSVCVVIGVVALAAVLLLRQQKLRWSDHFSFPLPQSAKVLNYHHSGGRDWGDEFEFSVSDDALRDAIIKQWQLTPAVKDWDVRSFASLKPSDWWPASKLNSLPERYGRVDEKGCRYWSLWVDRDSGKLYAEYGNW